MIEKSKKKTIKQKMRAYHWWTNEINALKQLEVHNIRYNNLFKKNKKKISIYFVHEWITGFTKKYLNFFLRIIKTEAEN